MSNLSTLWVCLGLDCEEMWILAAFANELERSLLLAWLRLVSQQHKQLRRLHKSSQHKREHSAVFFLLFISSNQSRDRVGLPNTVLWSAWEFFQHFKSPYVWWVAPTHNIFSSLFLTPLPQPSAHFRCLFHSSTEVLLLLLCWLAGCFFSNQLFSFTTHNFPARAPKRRKMCWTYSEIKTSLNSKWNYTSRELNARRPRERETRFHLLGLSRKWTVNFPTIFLSLFLFPLLCFRFFFSSSSFGRQSEAPNKDISLS